jgi:hypothetical protein
MTPELVRGFIVLIAPNVVSCIVDTKRPMSVGAIVDNRKS